MLSARVWPKQASGGPSRFRSGSVRGWCGKNGFARHCRLMAGIWFQPTVSCQVVVATIRTTWSGRVSRQQRARRGIVLPTP